MISKIVVLAGSESRSARVVIVASLAATVQPSNAAHSRVRLAASQFGLDTGFVDHVGGLPTAMIASEAPASCRIRIPS